MDNKLQPPVIKEGHDPFNGFVLLCKDDNGFWAEHQRDGFETVITDYLTEEEAEAKFKEFVNDSQFA